MNRKEEPTTIRRVWDRQGSGRGSVDEVVSEKADPTVGTGGHL